MNTPSAVTHLVYVPGLGDGYDVFRRIALKRWKHDKLTVSIISLKWNDPSETYEQKLTRVNEVIDSKPNARTVLVGESAGGAFAVGVSFQRADIAKVITICGKNAGANRVRSSIYRSNPAFRRVMQRADVCIEQLAEGKKSLTEYAVFYSPTDTTVRFEDTMLPGAAINRLPAVGHMFAIFLVLYVIKGRIITEALQR